MIAATPSATPARRGPSALPTLFIGVLVTLFAWGTAGRVEQRALDAAFHADLEAPTIRLVSTVNPRRLD